MKPRGLRRLGERGAGHYADDLHAGWTYKRRERDWSLRGFGGGIYELTAAGNPKVWWEARYQSRVMFEEDTLAAARDRVRIREALRKGDRILLGTTSASEIRSEA